jgi:hypothetical protein
MLQQVICSTVVRSTLIGDQRIAEFYSSVDE